MKLFVQGDDLLAHCVEVGDPIVSGQDVARNRLELARWLARYCEARGCEGTLVFVARSPTEVLSPTERMGRLTVRNLEFGAPAWAELAGSVSRCAERERAVVVTADRRLDPLFQKDKVTVQRPGEFLRSARRLFGKTSAREAEEADEKFSGLTDADVEAWLRYFQEGG